MIMKESQSGLDRLFQISGRVGFLFSLVPGLYVILPFLAPASFKWAGLVLAG
jgi:hypothetical protein